MPEPISLPPAPGEDTSTALALVNTEIEPRGEKVDLLPDGRCLGEWMRVQGLRSGRAAVIPDEDLDRMRRLRSAIRAVFTARAVRSRPPRPALTTINDAAGLVASTSRLRWNEDGPAEETVWSESAGATEVAFAELAASAIRTLLGDRGDRLRLCEAHGCSRMFIADHGRRRWCSRACGDRVRAARHHRKLSGAA
ncbi:MAG TPA: CGNR zinc finger domain-containing protein [Solirubrobacteraceae bacterium]|jgi:predicted RNA-binding Zn ribbon-like protein